MNQHHSPRFFWYTKQRVTGSLKLIVDKDIDNMQTNVKPTNPKMGAMKATLISVLVLSPSIWFFGTLLLSPSTFSGLSGLPAGLLYGFLQIVAIGLWLAGLYGRDKRIRNTTITGALSPEQQSITRAKDRHWFLLIGVTVLIGIGIIVFVINSTQ